MLVLGFLRMENRIILCRDYGCYVVAEANREEELTMDQDPLGSPSRSLSRDLQGCSR